MKNRKIKIYPPIKAIVMANHNEVEQIFFHKMPTKLEVIDCLVYDDHYLITKKSQMMERARPMILTGYGKHAGRKLWQAPAAVQRAVSMEVRPTIYTITSAEIAKEESAREAEEAQR